MICPSHLGVGLTLHCKQHNSESQPLVSPPGAGASEESVRAAVLLMTMQERQLRAGIPRSCGPG